jgi:hypothetical protein
MPAWLMPTLKAIAPHVGTILSATLPVFTKKSSEAANQTAILQQQVSELQTAAAANATHVRELAAQMQQTVTALEQGAQLVEARLTRLSWLCIAAIGMATASWLAIAALFLR